MSTLLNTIHVSFTARVAKLVQPVIQGLEFLAPLGDLAIRLWVAHVFWKSGLTKFSSPDTTLMLFTYEYRVPLLSPEVAACLATAVELTFPVLLALGLAGRASAFVLFVFNIMAVVSYPELNPAGLEQHQVWAIMLLMPLLHGPGKLSLDHLIAKWFRFR